MKSSMEKNKERVKQRRMKGDVVYIVNGRKSVCLWV